MSFNSAEVKEAVVDAHFYICEVKNTYCLKITPEHIFNMALEFTGQLAYSQALKGQVQHILQ